MKYRVCKICLIKKSRTFSSWKHWKGKPKQRYYRDKYGKLWLGRICPQCVLKVQTTSNHKRGICTPIDQVIEPRMKKGRDSEKRVAEFLKQKGFTQIRLTTNTGPDISFYDRKKIKTCEVKTVSCSKKGQYGTAKVRTSRLKDDYFAAVFPDGHILFEPMHEHLKKTQPSGYRSFQKEMRQEKYRKINIKGTV